MRTTEQLMKACQIGCSNLNDANSLLAECYGRLGRLNEENERMRNDAERYQWLRSDASAYQAQTILNDQPDAIDAAIDAARGAKPEPTP